jgi:hypothetical protein
MLSIVKNSGLSHNETMKERLCTGAEEAISSDTSDVEEIILKEEDDVCETVIFFESYMYFSLLGSLMAPFLEREGRT